jgi:hypothetical protein
MLPKYLIRPLSYRIPKASGSGDLLSHSPMHADAQDEVDYGGGISRERQTLDWFQIVCCSSRARVYIGAAEENPSNMGHAHVAHPSRLQQLTIRERPEPTSCDASVKDSVKRSVFLYSKDNLGSEAQFRKPRRTRASRRARRRSTRVALLFSLTYQVVQHPTLYVGLHLFQLSMWD